jgi:hypothetical protein
MEMLVKSFMTLLRKLGESAIEMKRLKIVALHATYLLIFQDFWLTA